MALGAQLPVRLESDVDDRLEKIAASAGTTKSALIRLLAKTFTDQVVDIKGRVTLPPDWKSLLTPADGRAFGALEDKTNLETAFEKNRERVAGKKPVSYRKLPSKKSVALKPPAPSVNETH